jgi:WD40 repeat protein
MKTIRGWDVTEWDLTFRLRGRLEDLNPLYGFSKLSISDDETSIAAVAMSRRGRYPDLLVHLRLPDLEEKARCEGDEDISCLAWSPAGDLLAVAQNNGAIVVRDQALQPLAELRAKGGDGVLLAWSGDGGEVAAASGRSAHLAARGDDLANSRVTGISIFSWPAGTLLGWYPTDGEGVIALGWGDSEGRFVAVTAGGRVIESPPTSPTPEHRRA